MHAFIHAQTDHAATVAPFLLSSGHSTLMRTIMCMMIFYSFD